MSELSKSKAVRSHRARMAAKGLNRLEVLSRIEDQPRLRRLASYLAEGGAEAGKIREWLDRTLPGDNSETGGILARLRRSPLVGADLEFDRPVTSGRDIDL